MSTLQVDPGERLDKNLHDLPPEEAASIRQVPGSPEESLSALGAESALQRKGDVFTDDVIRTWIDYNRTHEIGPLKLRPHPWEFHLYFDI